MRLAMEIFGIPAEAVKDICRAVHSDVPKLLPELAADRPGYRITVQEGTCPYTGSRYLSVAVDGVERVDLDACRKILNAIYRVHPLGRDKVVRTNSQLRIEDPYEVRVDGAPYDDDVMSEDDACWICGRLDGEECSLPEAEEPVKIEVTRAEQGGVPLCSVCRKLLAPRQP